MSNLPSRWGLSSHVAAFAGYALLVLVFVWPLPVNLADRITGDPAGDAGAYVWNAYVFSRNVSLGTSVFRTDRVLALANEASLALHNNSLLLSALAAPLVPAFGVIAAFNLALIFILVLNPFCAYLLARHETGTTGPAWLGGALFGFSPYLSARVEGHMSLATAFALPLVVLFARRAMAGGGPADCALIGISLALCAASDPYYLVFGVIALAVVWLFERATLEPVNRPVPVMIPRVAGAVALGSASALVWIGTAGGGLLALGPLNIGVRSPHTPVLLLTLAATALVFSWRPRTIRFKPGTVESLKCPTLSALVAGMLLSPWLSVAAAEVLSKGGTAAANWRSSPRGVDLLSFVLPNPTHPSLREFIEPWMTQQRADAFVEGVASWTLTAIVIGFVLSAYRQGSIPRFWLVFTSFFTALALGPFVFFDGLPTYIPGPWALFRYVPGIGMVRTPSRFAAVATLGVALGLAHLLATARLGRRRALVLGGVGLAMGVEMVGPPRRLFDVEMPKHYQAVAEDRCDVVVLRLPTGIKDGTRQRGRFSSKTQFSQVFHGKRLLGGYLSRLSDETVEEYEHHPTIHALLDLSEGKALFPEARRRAVVAARSLSREIGLGFIAVNRAEASADLRQFVQEAFEPSVVEKHWPFTVFVPFGETCASGECGHLPNCPRRARLAAAAP